MGWVCVYVCVSMHVCLCAFVFICMCVSLHACVYVCVCVCVCLCVCVCVCVCIWVYLCVCVCVRQHSKCGAAPVDPGRDINPDKSVTLSQTPATDRQHTKTLNLDQSHYLVSSPPLFSLSPSPLSLSLSFSP